MRSLPLAGDGRSARQAVTNSSEKTARLALLRQGVEVSYGV